MNKRVFTVSLLGENTRRINNDSRLYAVELHEKSPLKGKEKLVRASVSKGMYKIMLAYMIKPYEAVNENRNCLKMRT